MLNLSFIQCHILVAYTFQSNVRLILKVIIFKVVKIEIMVQNLNLQPKLYLSVGRFKIERITSNPHGDSPSCIKFSSDWLKGKVLRRIVPPLPTNRWG